MTNRQANCYGTALFFYSIYVALVVLTLGCAGCGNGDDDDDDCAVTNTCPDGPDAGSDVDADDDATTDADTTTPDGNTADACADYVNVPSDGWQCSWPGGFPNDANNLRFVVDQGVCRLRTDLVWCQDTPPAADVLTGQFTCADINGGTPVTCWHN